MSIAHDYLESSSRFLERLATSAEPGQPNMLLPSARFTVFALCAIAAGAVLAFVT